MLVVLELQLKMLEKPYAARALLLLYRFGPLNRGTLYDMLSTGATTPIRRIEELMAAGLIVEEVAEDRKRYLKLTEKGLSVAMPLDEIERALA
ncbi:MAG TPA: hypothetical protein PLD09_08575 [Methanomassiliicoccaceae archaeon]|jgi:DNA-binding MarR family transcriptional regulator|nr:hypothetical protein [Methanomassiliicoccaceae archaeon]